MIEFNEAEHKYLVDGVEVPSVTQVIRFLSADQARGADPVARMAAAERGTRIHSACCDYDYDDQCEVDGDITGYVRAYAEFLRDYQVDEWMAQELIVHGDICDYHIAGTIDRIGVIDGEVTVVDLKTGSAIHEVPVSAQTVAYSKLAEQSAGIQATRIAVLHLKKDGKYTFKYLPYMKGYKALKSCITIDRILKGDIE